MKVIMQTWEQSANLKQIIYINSDNIYNLLKYLKLVANQFSEKIRV